MQLADRVRTFCRTTHLRLNTDLGQHFLIDSAVLEAILDAAHLTKEDMVVEIGAGIGILTRELLLKTPHVTTIEIDARLIPFLRAYIGFDDGTTRSPTIIEGNALSVPFPSVPYKIVANIPYHITSPLLRHAFLEGAEPPQSLTLLIQREVAERICDAENAGLLTIVVGLFGTPRIVRLVPPSAFLPPPAVDSAVLHIDCFDAPRVNEEELDRILSIAKHAFAQKRKMLRNTMAPLPGGMEALAAAKIDPSRRPQTLSIDEWIAVAKNWTR